MARKFKPRTRKSGYRDAKLIVIATEGSMTEPQYFEALAASERYRNPRVHLEILERDPTLSAPEHVLGDLDRFRDTYRLNEYDELWLVIDLDRWGAAKISNVSSECKKKSYRLVVSNPCIELWLLLHFTSLEEYEPEQIATFVKNERNNPCDALEIELRAKVGEYNKSNLKFVFYEPFIQSAIENAKNIDKDPDHEWPNQLGTRVYRVVESILGSARS